MAAGRPALAYAAKEVSIIMTNPEQNDLENIRRVAKYMLGTECG